MRTRTFVAGREVTSAPLTLKRDETFPCLVGEWQDLCTDFDTACAERDRLQADNATLAAVLEHAVSFLEFNTTHMESDEANALLETARAALAAHAARTQEGPR